MTDYNERRNKILESLAHQAYLTAHAPGYTKLDGRTYKTAVDEAKQAITSLIKELVAEAKPNRVYKPYTNPIYNSAIYEFEHNLLKELEEA